MKKLFIPLLAVCIFLNGCGYGKDVESQAFVIAVGIDKGESFPLKVSFTFANPAAGTSSDGGEPSAPKPDTVSIEAPTVFSAVRKLDAIKSKAINLSHTKVVIFSKDVARDGIKNFLSGFASSKDFRPNTYVCISECTAEKFLKNIKPAHETFIEKYFDNIMQKVAEDKVNEAYLYYLFYNVTDDFSGSIVPLVGINSGKHEDRKKEYGDDFSYEARAGEIIRTGKNPAEVLGCAIFRNDKMIGTMGSFHTDLTRIMCNEFYPKNYSISYSQKNDFVTFRLIQQQRPETLTAIKNGNAFFHIKIPVSIEYIDAGKIEGNKTESAKFCKHLEGLLNYESLKLISESQKKYNCDILGLGNSLKRHFLDMESWRKFNWEEKYPEAKIKVSFQVIFADFEEAN